MTTVLLVDAPRGVRGALSARLSLEAGVDVIGEACDAAGALSLTEALRPEVVLVDAEASDLDVPSLVRALITARHAAVVVVLAEHLISVRTCLESTPARIVGKREGWSALVRAMRTGGFQSSRV